METNLYYFTVVAEEMSITRAASRLFISQQALSKHIAKLEKEYNTTLFERKPRLRLTLSGARMLDYAKHVIEMERDVLQAINNANINDRKKLPFGTSSRKGYIILPYILSNYSKIHPQILPSLYDGTKEFLDMMLSQGLLDCYFKMQGREEYTGKFEPLQKEELLFIVSEKLLKKEIGEAEWKSYLKDHSDGITVSDICRFPLLYPNEGSSLYETLSTYFRKYPVNIFAELNHYASAITLTHQGFCACFQTKSFYYDFVSKSPKLKESIYPLRIADIENISRFGVVYNPASEKNREIMEFVNLAKDAIKELDKNAETFLLEIKEKIENFK